MEYGMEQWNRKWDERMYTVTANLFNGTAQSRLSYLATMSDRSRSLISPKSLPEQVHCFWHVSLSDIPSTPTKQLMTETMLTSVKGRAKSD